MTQEPGPTATKKKNYCFSMTLADKERFENFFGRIRRSLETAGDTINILLELAKTHSKITRLPAIYWALSNTKNRFENFFIKYGGLEWKMEEKVEECRDLEVQKAN
jgi:hypothetical protein